MFFFFFFFLMFNCTHVGVTCWFRCTHAFGFVAFSSESMHINEGVLFLLCFISSPLSASPFAFLPSTPLSLFHPSLSWLLMSVAFELWLGDDSTGVLLACSWHVDTAKGRKTWIKGEKQAFISVLSHVLLFVGIWLSEMFLKTQPFKNMNTFLALTTICREEESIDPLLKLNEEKFWILSLVCTEMASLVPFQLQKWPSDLILTKADQAESSADRMGRWAQEVDGDGVSTCLKGFLWATWEQRRW